MLTNHKIGAVNGDRTRLNLIDSQVLSPECYHGIDNKDRSEGGNLKRITLSKPVVINLELL